MSFNKIHQQFITTGHFSYQTPVIQKEVVMYEVNRDGFQMLTKNKIAGYHSLDIQSIDLIYDLIFNKDVDDVFNYSISAMNFINDRAVARLNETQNKIVFRVQGKGGKIYSYLRHSIVNGVSKGKISSNYTYLFDVTWMNPQPLRWQIIGPESELFVADFSELDAYKDILSNREIEILELLSKGFRSIDIASALKLSTHTVNTHRKNMLGKLEATNTPELLMLARQMNLLSE